MRTLAVDYPDGHVVRMHEHGWHQLVYAQGGVITVLTASAAYVVPTSRAVWVPADVRHSLAIRGVGALRTLYLPKDSPLTITSCKVIGVDGLLAEVVGRCIELNIVSRGEGVEADALLDLLWVGLDRAGTLPTSLRRPTDKRAQAVADRLLEDPGNRESPDVLAERVEMSSRTLQRLFRAEVGMSLGDWRTQLRMLDAMRRLSLGESVSSVATAAGYEAPSAFVAAFRRIIGQTPGDFARNPKSDQFRL